MLVRIYEVFFDELELDDNNLPDGKQWWCHGVCSNLEL